MMSTLFIFEDLNLGHFCFENTRKMTLFKRDTYEVRQFIVRLLC